MTNQEAIIQLDYLKDFKTPDQVKALEMAIKALEQEPCEKDWRFYYDHGYAQAKRDLCCEDAISRQTVLKIIDGWYDNNRDTENIEDLIVLITYMDSVNPQEPKTGHWKPYLKEGLTDMCSECGSRFDRPWNYCPHCGARMVEP